MSSLGNTAVVDEPPDTWQVLPPLTRNGLPVTRVDNHVGAVRVSGASGPRVRSWLRMLLAEGPILEVTAPGRAAQSSWLFLCCPDRWPGARITAQLRDAGVECLLPGDELVPPTAAPPKPGNAVRWVRPPVDGDDVLPDQSAVVYAARRVIAERVARTRR